MSWDKLQERVYLESKLERKLQFFLFFFIVSVVISLIISQKEIAMIFLVIAVIISWLLTVSLWFFVNKINSVDKTLAASENGGPNFMERTTRFILAKVLPITASILLTMFLMVGVGGIADSILPYKQKVSDVIKDGKDKIESISERKPKKNVFVNVDSVVDNSKTKAPKGAEVTFDNTIMTQTSKDYSVKNEKTTTSGGVVKPAPKKVNVLLAVDGSHQAPKQNEKEFRNNSSTSNTSNQTISQTQNNASSKPDPHFAPVDRIIEKTPSETKIGSTKITPITKKDSVKKRIQPNPNFKAVDKVIKK